VSQEAAQTAGIGLDGGGVRRIALAVDMVIGQVVEFIGALLVLAETGILFADVVSRYVFNSPIIWTDELATFLFLWLAMIGAVVALRRDGHMRLTTFVSWVGPQWGGWLATLASLVLIVFVLEILVPAQQFLEVQRSTELITLNISDGYRVVAILVGASQGEEHPVTEELFGRNLRSAVPSLSTTRPRTDGSRLRLYEGIALRQERPGGPGGPSKNPL
jgi:TRAP-type C4-dicarboxylate transport system permease small subunit